MQVSLARKGLMTSAKSNNRIMNAARQIGKHSNPSGISMKPLGDFIVTPPGFHSNPSAAVVKPASRRIKTRQSATQYPPVGGSIPASRRRRRQAGIRASSGGSRTSVRRVLGLSCEHFSSMGPHGSPGLILLMEAQAMKGCSINGKIYGKEMNAARQRLRRLGRTAGARARFALSDCVVRTVLFGSGTPSKTRLN